MCMPAEGHCTSQGSLQMDFTNFLPPCQHHHQQQQQQKELEIHAPRTPATLAKPAPTRPLLISGNVQGQLESGSNWGGTGPVSARLHDRQLSGGRACQNGGSGLRDFPPHLQDLNTNDAAAMSALVRQVHSLNAASLPPLAFNHPVGGWAHIPCSSLLAFTDAYAARKVTAPVAPAPFLVTQIGPDQQASVPPNQLLLNGKVLLSPTNLGNSNNRQAPMSQHRHGFSIPLLPNLNASPENIESTVVRDPMPCPSTPATRDKGKRPVDDLPHEVIDLVEETVADHTVNERENMISQTAEEQQRDACFLKPMTILSEEVPSNPHASELHALMPSEASSVHPIEVEEHSKRENQATDLNKTTQQKPKRKKHRPKVIIEGKPARTPKPKTPKPVTPKPATNKETPTGKRKYVRKKNLNSVEIPSSAVRDIVEPADGNRMKSVRRSLNFDSEGCQARDPSLGSAFWYTSNADSAESEGQATCIVGTITNSSTKSDVQLTKGVEEVVVENSPATITFDLNQSVNQIPSGYITSSQKLAQSRQPSIMEMAGRNQLQDGNTTMPGIPTTPSHPSRRELIRENLNNLARKNGSVKVAGNLNSSPLDVLVTGSKRGHNFVEDASTPTHMNFINADKEANRVCECHDVRNNPCLRDTCKKRRTEEKIEFISNTVSVTSSSTPCAPSKSWNANQMVPNNSTMFTFTDAQCLLAQEKLQASKAMISSSQTENMAKNRLTESIRAHNSTSTSEVMICNHLSTPQKPYKHSDTNCNKLSAWGKPSGSDDQQESETKTTPACIETIAADRYEKEKPKARRKKGQAQVVSAPSDPNIICMQEYGVLSCNDSSVGHKSVRATAIRARNPRKKNSDILHISSTQDCQSCSSFQESPAHAVTHYAVLIEDIIQKLKHLDINKIHEDVTVEVQNALVLYSRGINTVVPYEGSYLVKKRRPRVKVDLDPETHRVWKLLMEKESTDGDDMMDKDKEKWWEEERQVFHGRADSFIARMHLVQGDRRFSQWKGSVVDSVVGVFLTQNVSDHLSSSAFMALAARFPVQSRSTRKEANADKMMTSAYQQEESILPLGDTINSQDKIQGQQFSDGASRLIHEAHNTIGKEMADSSSLRCCNGASMGDYLRGRDINFSSRELEIGGESPNSWSHESSDSRTDTPVARTGSTSYAEAEDRRSPDDVLSSQNSVVSSQNSSEYPIQTAFQLGSALETDMIIESMFNGMESSTSFTKLLEIANGRILPREYSRGINQLAHAECARTISEINQLEYSKDAFPSAIMSNNFHHAQEDVMGQPHIPSTLYHLQNSLYSRSVETESVDAVGERSLSNLPSSTSVLSKSYNINTTVRTHGSSAENTTEAAVQQKLASPSRTAPVINPYAFMSKQPVNVTPPNCSKTNICTERPSLHHDSISRERTGASLSENMSHIHTQSRDGHIANFQQNERKTDSQVENTRHVVEVQAQMSGCRIHQTLSKSRSNLAQTSEVTEPAVNPKPNVHGSHEVATETENNKPKGKKVRAEARKKIAFDWDSLRRQASSNNTRKERSSDTMDSIDWESVRQADVNEISNTIRERGMNNMLAERIKEFLNRLVRDHGSIDLEWLRDIPPDKAKDYLLSVRGLGIKSVECVRLLTLQHLAFPVDTNVGRICVRLGWVPLQPLPESLQLHLLELYPVLETIQKYLWPRLCTLDQRTLYELHYQMITFGKVFCTKSKPNCNACPMRGECKHFASAFASARLALPGPEEKSLVSSAVATASESGSNMVPNPMPLPQLEGSISSQKERAHDICEPIIEEPAKRDICEPIIEEPATPEPECIETSESAIEDAFFEDPDEIPTIKLDFNAFTQNLQNYMQANNMEIQDGDMSKALVLLSPEAASIPMPKLKNASRLRTEHQVYELPDSHPLLEGFDQREPDDPCSYLLAIWSPGETAQSTEPPKACCNSQETGRLCEQQTCFTCNSKREAESQTVRGTLLIPCRTAMRGSFPLNGTYFQVNEVFADHDSSHNPIDVPRKWIWNLPMRTVYFGTSIPTIFKGLSTEGIQHCFWRGFVCVRGFDRTTRAPKPLYARLHFPASKATRNKRTTANNGE